MNSNQNTLSIDFTMLSHQIHVLKLKFMPRCYFNALNCLMRLHGVTFWAPNCKQPPAKCFWQWFGTHRDTLAGTQPSLGSPCCFSDILTGWRKCFQRWLFLAANIHFSEFISSPVHSVLEVNEDPTITTYHRENWGPTRRIFKKALA